MRSIWLAGVAAVVLCVPSFAQQTGINNPTWGYGHDFGTNGYQGVDPARHRSNESPHRIVDPTTALKIRELRAEAIRTQEADGGKLTDEHRAQLQARLDDILAHASN
jgi:hypothetical protein